MRHRCKHIRGGSGGRAWREEDRYRGTKGDEEEQEEEEDRTTGVSL